MHFTPTWQSKLSLDWGTFLSIILRPPFLLAAFALAYAAYTYPSDRPTIVFAVGCVLTLWIVITAGVPLAAILGASRRSPAFQKGAPLTGSLLLLLVIAIFRFIRKQSDPTLPFQPEIFWVLFSSGVVTELFRTNWRSFIGLQAAVFLTATGWSLHHLQWPGPVPSALVGKSVPCFTHADFERIAPFTTMAGPRYWYTRQGAEIQLYDRWGSGRQPIDQDAIAQLEQQMLRNDAVRRSDRATLLDQEAKLDNLIAQNDAADFVTLAPLGWPKFLIERENAERLLQGVETASNGEALANNYQNGLRAFADARKLFLRAIDERKQNIDRRRLDDQRQNAEETASQMRQRLADQIRSSGIDERSADKLASWSFYVKKSQEFDQAAAALAAAHNSAEMDQRMKSLHLLFDELSAQIDRIRAETEVVRARQSAIREASDLRQQLKDQMRASGIDENSAAKLESWPQFDRQLSVFEQEVATLRTAHDEEEIARRLGSLHALFNNLAACVKTMGGDIATAAEKKRVADLIQRYVGNPRWTQRDKNRRIGVLIVSTDRIDDALTSLIVDRLTHMGVDSSGALLTPAFVKDGEFAKVFGGAPSGISDLRLGEQCEYLLIGTRHLTDAARSTTAADRFVVDRSLELHLISAASGKRVDGRSIKGHGGGFLAKEAEEDADREIRNSVASEVAALVSRKD